MPQTVTGNIDRHSADVLASLLNALRLGEVIDDQTGRTGPIQGCADSGEVNAGDGGGNLVLVTCVYRHGLNPGERVTLSGTPYDGDREVEPVDPYSSYILNVAYVADSTGGSWC